MEGDSQSPRQRHGKNRRLAFVHRQTSWLFGDFGRAKPHRPQTFIGNRFFNCAVGQAPANRQIVAAALLLHQRFNVITSTSLQSNRLGFLFAILVPLPRGSPTRNRRNLHFVGRRVIRTQKQCAAIVARQPKNIVAGLRRQNKAPHPLPVVVRHVGRRFKVVEDGFAGRLRRETGMIDQVRDLHSADVRIHFLQQALSLLSPSAIPSKACQPDNYRKNSLPKPNPVCHREHHKPLKIIIPILCQIMQKSQPVREMRSFFAPRRQSSFTRKNSAVKGVRRKTRRGLPKTG